MFGCIELLVTDALLVAMSALRFYSDLTMLSAF
jgi:hypothetical protein